MRTRRLLSNGSWSAGSLRSRPVCDDARGPRTERNSEVTACAALVRLLHQRLKDVIQRIGNTCDPVQHRIAFTTVIVQLQQLVVPGVLDDQLDRRGAGPV